MTCISCKKQIPDDAVYCLYCGKKQTRTAAAHHRRGNGLGSVYKMPCGTWTAERTLGFFIKDGKTKRKRSRKYGFKTKKEAVLYLEQLSRGISVSTTPTFSELWEQYQKELVELSKSKQVAYRVAWRKIEEDIAYRKIDAVSTPELLDIAAVAPTYYTRRDIKILLSHLYQLALRDDYVAKNRAQFISLPQKESTEREIFTDYEIEMLWEEYKKSEDIIVTALLIMLYTGMRPIELLAADCENIHLEEHFMTGGAKTERGKKRKIIIPDKIVQPIRKLIDRSENGKLLPYTPTTRDRFYDAWAICRDRLHLRSELLPYCCRHTYLTRLTALNVSPAMLQELAGHEDYDTTLNYTHLSVKDRLEAVNKL